MARVSADMSEFRALAKNVKGADKEIRGALFKAVGSAVKPVKKEIPDSARRTLPSRGGLNEWVATAQVQVRQSYSGRNPGVTIKASKAKTATSRQKTEHHDLIGPLAKGQTRTRTVRKRKAGTFGRQSDLSAINRGRVMHPAWGRGPLVGPQMINAGYFDQVMDQIVAVRAEKAIMAALREAIAKLVRSQKSAA